jgi:ADP-ribose pyrophosphatase YjhB (NUDIX family)
MPFTRLEIVVLSLVDGQLQVLLVRRAEAPHAGKWALPGGALRIDLDRSLEAAARRVMNERLGLELPFLRQLCAVGGPTRDPRAPWALSVVYRALVPAEDFAPSAGKRVEALAWRPVGDAIDDKSLAFDHAALIAQAVAVTRAEVERLELPFGILPQEFTLGELQATCEQLLGHRLDKSSFRRRLADRDAVEAVEGSMRGGAFRPAQLFQSKRA